MLHSADASRVCVPSGPAAPGGSTGHQEAAGSVCPVKGLPGKPRLAQSGTANPSLSPVDTSWSWLQPQVVALRHTLAAPACCSCPCRGPASRRLCPPACCSFHLSSLSPAPGQVPASGHHCLEIGLSPLGYRFPGGQHSTVWVTTVSPAQRRHPGSVFLLREENLAPAWALSCVHSLAVDQAFSVPGPLGPWWVVMPKIVLSHVPFPLLTLVSVPHR